MKNANLAERLEAFAALLDLNGSGTDPRHLLRNERRVGGVTAEGDPIEVTAASSRSRECEPPRRSLLGTTKRWPCKSNPVCLGSYVSRAKGASGDCGLSAGVLAAGPVKTP